jgi:hypothetical protein
VGWRPVTVSGVEWGGDGGAGGGGTKESAGHCGTPGRSFKEERQGTSAPVIAGKCVVLVLFTSSNISALRMVLFYLHLLT